MSPVVLWNFFFSSTELTCKFNCIYLIAIYSMEIFCTREVNAKRKKNYRQFKYNYLILFLNFKVTKKSWVLAKSDPQMEKCLMNVFCISFHIGGVFFKIISLLHGRTSTIEEPQPNLFESGIKNRKTTKSKHTQNDLQTCKPTV